MLLTALLVGCDLAAGETRRGDQPLRSLGDELTQALNAATFPWTPAADEASGAIVQTSGGAEAGSSAVTARVLAGGTGVSLRTDCADAARAGGAWPDNTEVDVVEYGSGRCAGWTRATTGSVTSWVRDEYLQGLPAAGERTAPARPGAGVAPQFEQLRSWTSRMQDGAGRLALLSRHSPDSMESNLTGTFIEAVRDGMRTLVEDISEAPPGACDGARRPLSDGANALADLAQRMRPAFAEVREVSPGLESLVARYAAAQAEAARLIGECAKA